MPRSRSRNVATGSEVELASRMVTSPGSLGAGVERRPGKRVRGKKSRHLAQKRKPEQPLSCMQPATLTSVSCEQFAPHVPVQQEQELHAQYPESKKGAVSRRKRERNTAVSQQLQDLSGQNQPTSRRKIRRHCMKGGQRSSNTQKGADSLRGNAEEECKAIEQVSNTRAAKKLKTNQDRSEDSKEEELDYSQFPTFTTLGETQSKTSLCHPVAESSGVQYKKRKPRADQIKCLQSFSVTTDEKARNVPAKCDAEHCRNALSNCNILLCATEKNPFVRLEACSYINTFVKSSASGTTSSCRSSRFLDAAHGKRKHTFPDGSVEHSDTNCRTSRMQNERSTIKAHLVFDKEETPEKVEIGEKSAVHSVFTDTANEYSELQTESAVAMSSAFAVLEPNQKESNLSASCSHTSDRHVRKNTHETKTKSVWRKNTTNVLAFEDGFKKKSKLSVIVTDENSNSVAHHSSATGSLRVPAQVCDVSSCHKSKSDEKLTKVNKKLQQVTCQRAEPMTGKKVWPLESCARTSEWFHKNHRSVSVRKRLSEAAFKESSVKSSVKAVGNSRVTGNLGQLAFHASSAEINKESTCKIMDPNTECLPSFDTPKSSSVDIRETSGESNENVESPVNMYRTSVAFNHNDAQEVKATLNFTPKQKGKNKGAATKRNLSLTVQNGTSTGNKTRIIANHESSVVDQTFSDLKLMKVSNTGNLTKLKIPLCRNKPESMKVESVHSFERKTCTPGELLDSTIVSRRQKKSEETSLVNSKQQLLPVARDAASTAPMKEKAYEDDVLIIDVIQDDPDLFGTTDEEQVAVAGCEDCPLKASFTSICIEEEKQDLKPKYPVISENRDSVDNIFRNITTQEPGMSNDTENSCHSVLKAKDIKTHNSSRGSSPLGGVTEDFLEDGQQKELDELLKSFNVDDKFRFADGVPDVKPQKKDEAKKSDCKDLMPCELLSGLPLQASQVNFLSEATVMKPRTNDDRFSRKSPLPNCECFEPLKVEKNAAASHSVQQILEMMELPRKYCRFYFMTLHGCERAKCWVWHIPQEGDEKVCMIILRTYISTKESRLLKRAGEIFVKYYRRVTPGVHFDSQVMHDLLISLLKNCLLGEVFQILHVTVQINTLPAVDVLLKVFEHVASLNLRDSVPALISTFCKLIDAGMFLKLEHFDNIIKFLHQLQVSSRELNIVLNIKSRTLQERYFEKNWLFDLNLAMAEIQHYKERNDWTMLGAFYVSVRTGCEHFGDLQKLCLCIAEILTRDSELTRPEVPFCDFADAVLKNSQHNEADRDYIGRTGITVMYSYHKVLQWTKGRKVLDKLYKLQINFTVLKGLTGVERLASRCDIVNKAADIFLKTGSLDGATWVLRVSEWTTNSPLWPCDKVDILNRHKLLCTLANEYLRKSSYRQALEVLQNLPSFHNHSDTVDVSQYGYLFNKLISACFESKNLGIPSSAIDFMLSKNIAIDFFLLRGLITSLGRSSLWCKARTYYKSALSLGCYPQPQGNLYDKVLMILSHMSEVEMLLAIEIFLVSNASVIQSPTAANQTLQIVLKRCEDQSVQNNSDYQAAVERLILAARLPDPKLILKHMTVNVNTDEVFSLELASALKWLQKNMKWAGKVWLFQ